ncbi:MAG: 6-phosphogluconolactonase [Alphaproteobacteria bacterium CG_4_10_14_0_2_um_filter_63_37]|nr:MAG: 6-phosphogluconolactonase [Proteobacteria bacterium CG1_02_64_396]PJA25899.1 MAG: 6-phosphogluconolactonase [Alphaproteobacteria bacterium CG_4_10_14_0_2_um_filter_63_37]
MAGHLSLDPRLNLTVLPDPAACARWLAATLHERLSAAVAARGAAHLLLSGGSTPDPLFRLWGAPPGETLALPEGVHLWWVDERFVPPGHSEHNATRALALMNNAVSPERVHVMPSEGDPETAAAHYGREIVRHLGKEGWWDGILLGLGGDGHTASLFPGSPLEHEATHRVMVATSPTGQTRLTLTPPSLKCSRGSFLWVAGESKRSVLRGFLENPACCPAGWVLPEGGLLEVVADQGAWPL